jgi:hypothetical protein
MDPKRCKDCGEELILPINFSEANNRVGKYVCKECQRLRTKNWRHDNRQHCNRQARQYLYQKGTKPAKDNPTCPLYLGVEIAENMLAKIFKTAKHMPNCNPGYDFICGSGKKIDVKASTIMNGYSTDKWHFNIYRNDVPDYFLLMAFDTRTTLNLEHVWLVPGHVINDKTGITISRNTIYKWKQYEKVIPSTLR